MHGQSRTLLSLGAVVALGGCSLTPPPEVPPLVERIDSLAGFVALPPKDAVVPGEGWWTAVGGEDLDDLVLELMDNSPVLQESREQVVQAAEFAVLATGQRLPGVGYSVDRTRSRAPAPGGDFAWAENFSAGISLNFNADILGGLRAAERAAVLTAEAAEYAYRASEQLEITRLVRNWVSAITLANQLELAKSTANIFETTYHLTDERYKTGSKTTAASDVLIARQNLEFALIDIPELERQLSSQLLIIDEQLARMPGTTASRFAPQSLPRQVVIPELDKPIALLGNRPDVAAAELRYRAALEDVGVVRANLYPALSLVGALRWRGDSPSDFSWDDYLASLVSSITGPLFQGGRLRSQVRLEQSQARELATVFARTAHSAVIDVEIALVSIEGLVRQVERSRDAVVTARQSNDLVEFRYRQGLTPLLSVLETQRSLNSAQQSLILSEQALANSLIDLQLSLGGDWT